MRPFSAGALALLLGGCAAPPYLELQIADDRLPFLRPGADFDRLGAEARAEGCPAAAATYPAAPLPATLTVVQGDCARDAVELRAFATLGDQRVAESRWLSLAFPVEGARVATATLAAASSTIAGGR